MRAISICQPWAWAIFHGKDIENRSWKTHYTGPLLIHSSNKFDHAGYKWILDHRHLININVSIPVPDEYPMGAIIGKVNMVGCVTSHNSPWYFDDYGHVYSNPVEFKKYIPFRGALHLFEVPDELVKGLT